MIRAVTLDWWGTIAEVPDGASAREMRRLRIARFVEAAHQEGIRVDPTAVERAYDQQGDLLTASWARHVEPSPDEQVDIFLRLADLDRTDPRLVRAVGEAFGGALLDRPPRLFPRVPETLERLRAAGYAIGLVSNTGRTWGRYLRALQEAAGIGRYFTVRIFSDEVGARKPDPRIFHAALAGLPVPAAEVAHVGDDPTADIAGARSVGMRAVWFDAAGAAAAPSDADAVIRDHGELLAVLGRWAR